MFSHLEIFQNKQARGRDKSETIIAETTAVSLKIRTSDT
jgi:hypothetical protein